jgi:serine/threonine protein phosphatase PrpC
MESRSRETFASLLRKQTTTEGRGTSRSATAAAAIFGLSSGAMTLDGTIAFMHRARDQPRALEALYSNRDLIADQPHLTACVQRALGLDPTHRQNLEHVLARDNGQLKPEEVAELLAPAREGNLQRVGEQIRLLFDDPSMTFARLGRGERPSAARADPTLMRGQWDIAARQRAGAGLGGLMGVEPGAAAKGGVGALVTEPNPLAERPKDVVAGERSTKDTRAVFASVIGGSHVKSGQPREDAVLSSKIRLQGGKEAVITALADGHGDPSYFRSERGSQLATWALNETVAEVALEVHGDPRALTEKLRTVEFKSRVVTRWKTAVTNDIKRDPYDEAVQALSEVDREKVRLNPLRPYGSTLLGALKLEDQTVFFRLGDGDVVLVDDRGKVSEPLPDDPNNVVNFTTSLCHKDAVDLLQVHVLSHAAPPQAIMLSSDGLTNSYSNDKEFYREIRDIVQLNRSERSKGSRPTPEELVTWLKANTGMIGDDISAMFMFPASST